MAKINKLVVFGEHENLEELLPEDVDAVISNIRFWNGKARGDADAVYAPDFPKVEAVYEEAGKIVYRPEGTPEKAPEAPQEVLEETPEETTEETSEVAEEAPEESYEEKPDWRNLSWPKLRSLAATLTDEPIKSKGFAKEVLEKAEQEGRI